MLCTNPDMLDLACRKSNGSYPDVFGAHNVEVVKAKCDELDLQYFNAARAMNNLLDDAPAALIDYCHNPYHKPGWSIGIKVMAPLLIPRSAMYTDDDVLFPQGCDLLPLGPWATNGGMGGQVLKSSPKSRELVDDINRVMGTKLDPYLWWDKQCDVGVWNLWRHITVVDYKFELFKFYGGVQRVREAKRDSLFFRETDQLFFTVLWHMLRLPDTMSPCIVTGKQIGRAHV